MNDLPKYILLEKMGIWNYSPDVQNYITTHSQCAEKIYTYARKEILKTINKTGVNFASFVIPEKLLNIDVVLKSGQKTQKKLTNISIHYKPDEKASDMMSVGKITDNCTILSINIDISHRYFKSTFFHELKHIWQQTFEHYTEFIDIFKQNKSNNFSDDFNRLMKYVYVLNPDEFSSFRENIYTVAYERFIKNISIPIKSIINDVKRIFHYDNSIINDIDNIYKKHKQEVEIYFLILWLHNINYSGVKVKYNIFSKNLSYTKDIIRILKKISIENSGSEFFVINSFASEFIKEEPEFAKVIFEDGFNNLKQYVKDYQKAINKIIYNAYEDAKHDINNSIIDIDKTSLFNYILYNDDSKISLELKLTDNINVNRFYYAIISDNHIYNVFLKIYILCVLYKDVLKIQSVFKGINTISKNYKFNNLDKNLIYDLEYPKYKTIKDIPKIVDFINDIDVDEIF